MEEKQPSSLPRAYFLTQESKNRLAMVPSPCESNNIEPQSHVFLRHSVYPNPPRPPSFNVA